MGLLVGLLVGFLEVVVDGLLVGFLDVVGLAVVKYDVGFLVGVTVVGASVRAAVGSTVMLGAIEEIGDSVVESLAVGGFVVVSGVGSVVGLEVESFAVVGLDVDGFLVIGVVVVETVVSLPVGSPVG